MADILRFKARSNIGAGRTRSYGKSAEIVIFPGIRYDLLKNRDKKDGAPAAPAQESTTGN